MSAKEKGWLYVGHYIDMEGNYILKIGETSTSPQTRAKEHTYGYKKELTRQNKYRMPKDAEFIMDWWLPLSMWTTRKYETRNREIWKEKGYGEYVRNDRFCCAEKPEFVEITIKKTYRIPL